MIIFYDKKIKKINKIYFNLYFFYILILKKNKIYLIFYKNIKNYKLFFNF